jgi:hypothetical protein
MNHRVMKLITAGAASLFILSAWVVPGTSAVAGRQNLGQTAHLYANSAKFSWIALNENSGNHPDRRKEADSDADSKKREPTPDPSGRSGQAKSKPLAPFVPSEKISADQAVDFPADI